LVGNLNSDAAPLQKKSAVIKEKKLTNTDIAAFLVKNNIRHKKGLLAIAKQRHDNGLSDIYNYVLGKNPKALADLICTTWMMHEAPKMLQREGMERMEVVFSYLETPCVDSCQGVWLSRAHEVLKNNHIDLHTFAKAMRNCLTKGRQKYNNIMLTGPTNCGKSFLLDPLESMFKCFTNPTADKYAWVPLEGCEVALINELRWTEEFIRWSDFLLLLEGQTVHLPRPKNLYATDLCIERNNKIAFFATAKEPIRFTKYNIHDPVETEMMNSRWRIFNFEQKILKIINTEPCPHCFSTLLAEGM